jgi:hypothetical protein
MGNVQKRLNAALLDLTDRDGGVAAKVDSANRHIVNTLDRRTKALDELLHEFKTDLLRIWIPLATGGAMLIGMFAGMEIQGCKDSQPVATTQSLPMQILPMSSPEVSQAPATAGASRHTQPSSSKRDRHVDR